MRDEDIQVQMTVDLNPFEAGLKQAVSEAETFGTKIENDLIITPTMNEQKIREQFKNVKIIAKDTGKEIDKLTKERYIDLNVDASGLRSKLAGLKAQKDGITKAATVKLDLESKGLVKELNLIQKKKKEASGYEIIKLDVREKEIIKDLKRIEIEKQKVVEPKIIKITAKTKKLTRDLVNVERGIRNIENTGKETTSRLTGLFGGLSKSLKTGLLSTFGAFSIAGGVAMGIRKISREIRNATDAAISFESAFTGVRKTVDATDRQFNSFSDELKKLSKEIPLTYEELAKIGELGGQMGVPIESLKVFTKTVAQLGATTNLTSEEASLAFSRIANVVGLPLDQVDKLGSAVVALGNNFAAQENEITNFSQRISGAGRIANLSIGDITGISTALTSVGIQAEKGGTAVNKALLKINDSVIESGDNLEKFASVAGLSADEFANMWRDDAGEAFTLFIEGLKKSGDGANKIIEDLLGNNVRTKESFLNLANAGDLLRRAINLGNSSFEENSALQKEAALRFNTTESKLKRLNNELRIYQAEIGDKIIPVMISLKTVFLNIFKGITQLVDMFSNLSKGAKIALAVLGSGGLLTVLLLLSAPLAILAAATGVFATVMAKLGKEVEETDKGLSRLQGTMADIDKDLNDTQEAIDKLSESFYAGKISIDEYNRELVVLMKKKGDLQDLADQTAANIGHHQALLKQFEGQYTAFERAQSEYEKAQKKENATYKKNGRELAKILKQKRDLKEGTEGYTESLSKLEAQEASIYAENKKSEEATAGRLASFKQEQVEIKEMSKLDRALAANVINSYQAKRMYNNIHIDESKSKAQVGAMIGVLQAENKAILQVAKNKLLLTQQELADANAKLQVINKMGVAAQVLPGVSILWGKLNKDVEGLTSSLEQQTRAVQGLQQLGPIYTDSQVANTSAVNSFLSENTDKVIDQISAENELTSKLTEVNNLISKGTKNQGDQNKLIAYRKKLTDKLTQIEKERNGLPKDYTRGVREGNDALKTQTELIRARAAADIEALGDVKDGEVNKAKTIVEINRLAEAEIQALKGETYKTTLQQAEDIIDKWEEIKEKGKESYNEIGASIEDTLDGLKELQDQISEVNDEIDNIDTTAVEDISDRYEEIQSELNAVNNEIEELNTKISEASGETVNLKDQRKDVSKNIKDSDKAIEGYEKSITNIAEKTDELNKTTEKGLAERYIEIGDQLAENNAQLDDLNTKSVLSTEEAARKAKLEEENMRLLQEQALAKGEITQADIDRANLLKGESETERLIRERDEKLAIYNDDLKNLTDKLAAEQVVRDKYAQEAAIVRSQLDEQEMQEQNQLLADLNKQLADSIKERDALIKEKYQAEALLSDEQLKAISEREKQTQIQAIEEKRQLDLASAKSELSLLLDQQNAKLDALKEYYFGALQLKKAFMEKFGEKLSFDDIDVEEFKKKLDSVQLPNGDRTDFALERDKLTEQEQAIDKLENIAELFNKIDSESLQNVDTLKNVLNEILKLRQIAATPIAGQDYVTNDYSKRINMSNSINVDSLVDAESLARAIRMSLKL